MHSSSSIIQASKIDNFVGQILFFGELKMIS